MLDTNAEPAVDFSSSPDKVSNKMRRLRELQPNDPARAVEEDMTILDFVRKHLKDVLVPLCAAALGAIATLGVATTDYWHKDQQIKIQMLNIALGILREDPKTSKLAAARGWAIDIINTSAPVKIPDDARQELSVITIFETCSAGPSGGSGAPVGWT